MLILIRFLYQMQCQNAVTSVVRGERVHVGQVLADGPATSNGELAIGKNALIGFMTWDDIRVHRLHIAKYSVQSKVILAVTGLLILIPAVWLFLWD